MKTAYVRQTVRVQAMRAESVRLTEQLRCPRGIAVFISACAIFSTLGADSAVGQPAPRELLLQQLRQGFSEDLPFFGLSLFGVAGAGDTNPQPSWDNIPITPIYQLGTGDEIVVSIWGSLDMEFTLQVNDRGSVTMPNADRVYVNGMTFGELTGALLRSLRQGYAEALSQQHFDSGAVQMKVTLGEIRGIQVLVAGQVNQQGGITFNSPSALLMDALTLAGGITSHGSLRNILVRRGAETRALDLYDLMVSDGVELGRFILRQGDVVHVPYRQRTVSITGAVRQPAIYEMAEAEDLDDLLRLAGGLAPDADASRVQIERKDEDQGRRLLDVDLKRQGAERIAMRDGDQVRVPQVPEPRRRNVVELVGSGVRKPGTYELITGETMLLQSLLSRAGLYEDAILERCLLIRMKQDYTREKIELDLRRATAEGFRLQPEDRFIINSEFRQKGGDKQITLSGHVKLPDTYLLSEGLTLYDVLHNYGGFEDPDYRAQTHLARAEIIRVDKDTGQETIIPFDLGAVLERRDDFPFESEDKIVVYPKDQFIDDFYVQVGGEVRAPGRYRITQEMGLGDVLVQAGWMTDKADSSNIELTRVDAESEGLRATRLLSLERDLDMRVRDWDLIQVRRKPEWHGDQVVILTGEFIYPGQYSLKYGERLSQVIDRADGFTSEAFVAGARYYRSVGQEKRRVGIDLVGVLGGDPEDDLPMQDGDSLHVPLLAQASVVDVGGEVLNPQQVHYVPGKKVGYFISATGGGTGNTDASQARIYRANGLAMQAHRRLWFDPAVPPGSTIFVPGKTGQRRPAWRNPYVVGAVVGALLAGGGVTLVAP